MSDDVPIRSVRTSLEIVERIVRENGARLSELVEHFDRPKSTVHDHLVTLERQGYLIQEEGTYKLSSRFLRLGEMRRSNMSLYNNAQPELERLADETGHSISLIVMEHDHAVIIQRLEGEEALAWEFFDGLRMKMHSAAPGKAMLAYLPDPEIRRIIDEQGLEQRTTNTITSEEELFRELERIREVGYALDDGERVARMRNVAVPILDRGGNVKGCVTVSGPETRVSDEEFRETIPELLLQSRNAIEILFNYQ